MKLEIMKKVLILGLVIAGFSLTSCKKDITCECVQADLTITEKSVKAKSGEEDAECANAANKVLTIPTEICTPK